MKAKVRKIYHTQIYTYYYIPFQLKKNVRDLKKKHIVWDIKKIKTMESMKKYDICEKYMRKAVWLSTELNI